MKKLILSTVCSLIFISCNSEKKIKPINNFKTVKTISISPQTILKTESSSGIAEPLNEVSEITKTGGNVEKINFKNGEKVKKGQTILELSDSDVLADFLKSEATFFSAKNDFKIKEENFNKFTKLFKSNFISQDEYSNKKIEYLQSEATLKTAEANYILAKNNYDDLKVKAKIDGVITDLNLKKYQKVEANTKLFTIVNSDTILVNASVSPSEINNINKNLKANILFEGVDKNYVGKIYEINPSANSENNKYSIKLQIDNKDSLIKKGMYADILLNTGEKTGYLVPKEAIVLKELYSYIFVVENNQAKMIKIERGYENGKNQEIKSDELYPNMSLVIDGQYLLEDRDKVNIIK